MVPMPGVAEAWLKQEALLWQRDCATRLSVEILQLQTSHLKLQSQAYRVALFA